MESPLDTIIEEKEAMMVSPNDRDPFLKTAYFLKPIVPSSINEPPLSLPQSLTSSFNPKEWPLRVNFHAWHRDQTDWRSWVDHMAPIHRSTWKKAGVDEAIFNSRYEIKRKRKTNSLIYGLAEKWCCETNTFMFSWGEATVSLEDVMILGGYSVLGDTIFKPLESRELNEIQEKLTRERTEFNKSTSKKASQSLWLKKFVKSGSELEHEAFLAYWLSRYVFTDGRGLLQKLVFPIAIHLARGTRIALAPAVLACIYRDLSLLKRAIVASNEWKEEDGELKLNLSLKSPFHLVQVWAWEKFAELGPKPNVIDRGDSRLALWDKVNGLDVENWRTVLNSFGDDFVWRPYARPIENWSFPKYYSEKEMWIGPGLHDESLSFAVCLRPTELAGFDTTEQYFPHRVARQFGYDQDLPCSVAQLGHCADGSSREVNADEAWRDFIEKSRNVKLYIPSRLLNADISTRYMKWWKESMSVLKDRTEHTMLQQNKGMCCEGSVPSAKWATLHPGSHPKADIDGSNKRRKLNGFNIPSVSELRNDGHDSLVPPGFPPKCTSRMEAGGSVDEDAQLTLRELLERHQKKKNVGTDQCGGSEKILDQVQNLASSFAERSFDSMESKTLEKEETLNEILTGGCKAENKLSNVMGSQARSSDIDIANIVDDECASSSSAFECQVSALKTRICRLQSILGLFRADGSGNKL